MGYTPRLIGRGFLDRSKNLPASPRPPWTAAALTPVISFNERSLKGELSNDLSVYKTDPIGLSPLTQFSLCFQKMTLIVLLPVNGILLRVPEFRADGLSFCKHDSWLRSIQMCARICVGSLQIGHNSVFCVCCISKFKE